MRLPKDLLTQTYTKPRLFLCETDKSNICQLDTIAMQGSFKFNSYSELSFTVGRTYMNIITGETKVNPFYDKIEGLRLVYLEGFGYFEIQDPEIVSDGIKEIKNVTAYSLEYSLSQKYIQDFNINTGDNNSLEVVYAQNGKIVPVQLYNPYNTKLSLLHVVLEKVYGWKIGHIDVSLQTMTRSFEISRVSVYDFITQDICENFNCFAVFDTEENTINLYAETLITKHKGNGNRTSFIISPPYKQIGSVTIDSYKTTRWQYNYLTGELIFDTAPKEGALIEITDASQEKWQTDVYISFNNLAQEVNVSYSTDDIKTVLTVKGADDLSIREVNMGLPYIVDISYYYHPDWMGDELYQAYGKYLEKCNEGQDIYKQNSQMLWEIDHKIAYEQQRLSLEYSVAEKITPTTVGTYYVRGGDFPNYYYTEVKLPDEYNANIENYYAIPSIAINETKVENLYRGLQKFYNTKETTEIADLKEGFSFMKTYTIDYLISALTNAVNIAEQDIAVLNFLGELWEQVGLTPLKALYYEPYKRRKLTNEEAGWNNTDNVNYWLYYPVNLMLTSLEQAIQNRTDAIDKLQIEYKNIQNQNVEIANGTLIDNNFTPEQLIRLNAFLREDEYTDDNFIELPTDTFDTLMQTKQELLECGRIELSKLCEPKLSFSMDMANIYALPEFEPIIDQFQLGNLINVVLRENPRDQLEDNVDEKERIGYKKQARLLAVDINFHDFFDFSCEFGELTNLRTPSSIHADLLATAMTAGKTVASNASYWNKGSDTALSTDLKLQQGLLDAATAIKSIDGVQGTYIDQYGIHLQKIDPNTGAIDPKEGWIVNNQFLYSDDNFKTSKSVFGEYVVDGETKWGLLAEAVIAGYIEGSTIIGGRINIGDGAFVVNPDGSVSMSAPNTTIEGYAKEEYVNNKVQTVEDKVQEINDQHMYRIEVTVSGPTTITYDTDITTMTCKVYSWDADITDTLDNSLFMWKRTSNNKEQDNIWNLDRSHIGTKTITITKDDIYEQATFNCVVDLPD